MTDAILERLRRNRGEAALVVLQLAYIVATRATQPLAMIDDAYIHFRCALNWAVGDGLVFNAGQPVLGTTSPVFALALGVVLRFFGVLPHSAALGMNMLLDAGVVLMAIHWMRGASVPLLFRHAVALALSAEPNRLYFSVCGMEMSLFVFATMTAIELLRRGQWAWCGFVLGWIGWVRPEGAVIWLLVAGALAV